MFVDSRIQDSSEVRCIIYAEPGLAEELCGNLEECLATAAIPVTQLVGQRSKVGRCWKMLCQEADHDSKYFQIISRKMIQNDIGKY